MANIVNWKFYQLFSVIDGVRSFRKIVYVKRHTNFNVWFGNVEYLGKHEEQDWFERDEEEVVENTLYRLTYEGDEERLSKNQTLVRIELDEGYGVDYENLTLSIDSYGWIQNIYDNDDLDNKGILCHQCSRVSIGNYGYEEKPMCLTHKHDGNYCGCGEHIQACINCRGEYSQDHYELLVIQEHEEQYREQREQQVNFPPNNEQPPNA
jgi:hypothetical protein